MIFFKTSHRNLFQSLVTMRNTFFGNKKYKKFVIIGAPRTGSNWLVSLLNSHPKIMCLGERYKNLKSQTSLQIWDEIFSKRKSGISYLGFKLLYNHPQDSSEQFVWDRIKEDPEIVIIHLHRKNLLRSYVSLEVGNKTGVWIKTEKSKSLNSSGKQVLISKADCLDYFISVTEAEESIKSTYTKHVVMDIYYEDLVDDYQNVMNDIFAHMRLEPIKVSSNIKKQNPESLKNLIVNYNELELELRESKWYKFLNS